MPDDFLHTIWSSQLPPNMQAILVHQPEGNLDAAACCVGHISEVALQLMLASVAPPPNSTALLQGIEDLSRKVAALSSE
jgi:hypothetical protein